MLKDRWLWAAIAAGCALRLLPMFVWPQTECVRDECIYRFLAIGIERDGVLGVTTKGWLAAPGYPYMLAWFKATFGTWFSIKWVQIALSVGSIPVLYAIATELVGDPKAPLADRPVARRAGRWAAWGLALHPTVAWYSNTWWIETIYIAFLLPAVLGVLWARRAGDARHALGWAAASGLCLGVCILFRGVATFLPPLFVSALLWPDDGLAALRGGLTAVREAILLRLRPAAALVLVAVVSVAPYSVFASSQYGGFMVSDATVGHVLYLGNNDFPPMTFDYGNGALTQPLFYRTIGQGRRFCDRDQPPVHSNACEVDAAVEWITSNPGEFVSRIPMRLAQQLNPNTFLTRHVRWGFFRGLPYPLKELLCIWIALTSVVITLGGTAAGFARGRGAFAVMAGGTIAYTMFAAAVMYGMSRFRLPLEPLWLVWLGVALADPPAFTEALRASRARAVAVVVSVPLLVGLMSWYALTGFPLFWR
jgi:hypothetical protein